MSGSTPYLHECPEDVCRVTFIGACPREVLEHIQEAHGQPTVMYYVDNHDAFEAVPREEFEASDDE